MKLTSVVLTSSDLAEPITFTLKDSEPTSQYIVRSIVGIDAEELISNFYGFSANTRTKQYEFKLKPRDVVMRIVLQPRLAFNETYSQVRDDLYKAISATRNGGVTLGFRAEATTVSQLTGRFQKVEAGYFNQLPEIQITIKCDDPIFRGVNAVSFSAEDLGTVNPIKLWDSLSTAPHGFTMRAIFGDPTDVFTIQDAATDIEWLWRVIPNTGFVAGDILYMSSEFGKSDCYMIRGPFTIPLMDSLTPSSVWPVIFPGENEFHIPQLPHIEIENFEYLPAYWGV